MLRILFLLCLAAISGLPLAAQACGRDDVQGAYGFQLSGTINIGTNGPQPMAAVGLLVFDGHGAVGGVSSAALDGYFLGNPATGSYSFKTDCSLRFELRDDSGATQHFSGVATAGGARVEIHQTDPDTGERGVLERTPADCNTASLQGAFALSMSGTASQFATDQPPGSAFSLSGTVTADGAGNLVLITTAAKTTGSYQLDSDCVAEMELGVSNGESAGIVKLRGVLVNQGKLVLAVESDPARIATARLTLKGDTVPLPH